MDETIVGCLYGRDEVRSTAENVVSIRPKSEVLPTLHCMDRAISCGLAVVGYYVHRTIARLLGQPDGFVHGLRKPRKESRGRKSRSKFIIAWSPLHIPS